MASHWGVVRVSNDDQPSGDELCDTECLDLLGSKRRQTVLEQLVDGDDRTQSLGSLATAVAQSEQGSELGAVPTERVRISLHHAHLPKLDDAGVVDYDSHEQTVEYLGSPPLERWLDQIEE